MRVGRSAVPLVGMCLWLLVWASSAIGAAPTWDELRAYYAYDATTAPEATVVSTETRGQFAVENIVFTSVNGQVVPLTLCKPRGVEKPPVILALHGLGGDGKSFATQIEGFIAAKGIAVAAIDAQYHGGRKVEGKDIFSGDLPTTVEAFRQTIIDNRRALDYMVTRADLNTEVPVLIGASMGGIMGSVVSGLDDRIKQTLLIVGGGDLVGLFTQSKHPAAEKVRAALNDSEAARRALEMVEPTNFVGHISPRPLLMVNGRDDKIIPQACAEALYAAAKDPKQIVWYDGGMMDGHVPPLSVLFTELKGFLQGAGVGKWQ